jgi:CheY-like chemotaxis protein
VGPSTSPPTFEVVVADDNVVYRRGLVEMLEDVEPVTVVSAVDQLEALEWTAEQLATVRLAFVDLADIDLADQLPGIGAVRHLRRLRHMNQTIVVAYTSHWESDAARYRVIEAGADFLLDKDEMEDMSALLEMARRPPHLRDPLPRPNPEVLSALGIQMHRSQINEAVTDHWFEEQRQAGRLPVRRREAWRSAWNRVARILPVNRDGRPRDADDGSVQSSPSMPQIARVMHWARNVVTVRRRPRSGA